MGRGNPAKKNPKEVASATNAPAAGDKKSAKSIAICVPSVQEKGPIMTLNGLIIGTKMPIAVKRATTDKVRVEENVFDNVLWFIQQFLFYHILCQVILTISNQ